MSAPARAPQRSRPTATREARGLWRREAAQSGGRGFRRLLASGGSAPVAALRSRVTVSSPSAALSSSPSSYNTASASACVAARRARQAERKTGGKAAERSCQAWLGGEQSAFSAGHAPRGRPRPGRGTRSARRATRPKRACPEARRRCNAAARLSSPAAASRRRRPHRPLRQGKLARLARPSGSRQRPGTARGF